MEEIKKGCVVDINGNGLCVYKGRDFCCGQITIHLKRISDNWNIFPFEHELNSKGYKFEWLLIKCYKFFRKEKLWQVIL